MPVGRLLPPGATTIDYTVPSESVNNTINKSHHVDASIWRLSCDDGLDWHHTVLYERV